VASRWHQTNISSLYLIRRGTVDGEWDITVQWEEVSWVKSNTFLVLRLKSNPVWDYEIKAVVRKWETPIKIMDRAEHIWLWWEGGGL
jgi:hypothetical protein